jgi:endonuclease YncB( thermonuclease family)
MAVILPRSAKLNRRSGVWQVDFERPKDWRKRHPRTG